MSRERKDSYSRLPMYSNSNPNTARLRLYNGNPTPYSPPPSPFQLPPSPDSNGNGYYVPPPRRRWSLRWPTLRTLRRPRFILQLFKYLLPACLFATMCMFIVWDPHIEIALYPRAWVKREVTPLAPLRGCFKPDRVSQLYNVTEHLYSPKRAEVQAGFSLKLGMDCYNFAGTIQPSPAHQQHHHHRPRIHYHTYWRTDLAPFGDRQEWMLISFFATQDLARSRLILWSNGELTENPILRHYVKMFPDAFEMRIADVEQLAKGTELEGNALLGISDQHAWVDGDLIRLLVVWRVGGVWIDMDTLLTRDLSPLLEHEFVTQWDCYGASFYFSQRHELTCPRR